MKSIKSNIETIRKGLPNGVQMICVSKFHPISTLQEAYDAGARDFGESRVQELIPKYNALPKDIRWHFIGHLQTNKVRQIVPFVYLIHSVDSQRLLEAINAEAKRIQRKVKVLLEIHIAKESSKSGFDAEELPQLLRKYNEEDLQWVEIVGVMGMATHTDDEKEIRRCFKTIKQVADQLLEDTYTKGILRVYDWNEDRATDSNQKLIISMGMSDDYPIAIEEGSNMVRIGSSIFGERK